MPVKAGLDSAVDSTKLVITLDGALIAFVTGTTFLAHITTASAHWAVFGALLFLAASMAGGLMVLFEAGSMISNKNYDLGNIWIRVPGIVNMVGFALGSLCVAALAMVTLVFASPAKPAPPPPWKFHCLSTTRPTGLECSGTTPVVVNAGKD